MYSYSGDRYYSSSSDTDSDLSYSSDEDEGSTVITINGKVISPDDAASRLGNIHIGSGRCMFVGGKPKGKRKSHHEHFEKKKKEKSKEKHAYHIDTKTVATKDHFDIVASEIGKHWKKLAKELGLSRGTIEAVSIDFYPEGHYEQAYQALRKWSQKEGKNAKLVDLVNALKEIGFEELCSKLGKGNR